MKKRILALLLALTMVVSMLPVSAFATSESGETQPEETVSLDKNGDGEIIYVSLGDSTTNGYGLTGYELDQEALDWAHAQAAEQLYQRLVGIYGQAIMDAAGFTRELVAAQITKTPNVNGLLMETPGAYPALFRKYLEDKTDLPVNLIQLAISGARADNIYTLLTYGKDNFYPYDGSDGNTGPSNSQYKLLNPLTQQDKYPQFDLPFDWHYLWNYQVGGNYQQARLESNAKLFQNSIAYADIISVNMGSNNFSTYLHNYLKGYMMGGDAGVAATVDYQSKIKQFAANHPDYPDLDKKATELVVALKAELNSQIISGIEDEKLQQVIDGLIDRCVYTFVGYCVSYVGVHDRTRLRDVRLRRPQG